MLSKLYKTLLPVKYYVISLIVFLAFYTWSIFAGYEFFGDDNIASKSDGAQHNSVGHGTYFHK